MPLRMPEDKLLWAGTWEPEVSELIRQCCEPGFRCLDIGSYRGFFAAVMARAGAASVDAFEPNPANRPAMQKLLELNPDLGIRFHPAAVGNQEGKMEFLVHEDLAMGKIKTSTFQADRLGNSSLPVPMRTLDGLLARKEIPEPHFIKLDVEGAEAMVLQGAADLLGRGAPIWLIECHSRELAASCARTLQGWGYDFLWVLETQKKFLEYEVKTLPEICHLLAKKSISR